MRIKRNVKTAIGLAGRKNFVLSTLLCAALLSWAGCVTQRQQMAYDDPGIRDANRPREVGMRGSGGSQQQQQGQNGAGGSQQQQQGQHGSGGSQQQQQGQRGSGGSQQQQQGMRGSGGSQQQQQRPVEPAPVRKAEVKAEPKPSNEATLKTDLVNLTKKAPPAAAVGEEFAYEITYTALENLESLTVADQLPEGVSFVRAEPAATPQNTRLVWVVRDLDKGASGSIQVFVRAEREGTAVNCASVTAVPKVCVATVIGRAAVTVEKSGPATAVVDSDVVYNIVVRNNGTLPARGVVVTDTVPEGMSHQTGGRNLRFEVGNLGANESREIPVTLRATTKGRFCNVVTVASANAGSGRAEACTQVLSPGLKVAKTGDREQFLSRQARYRIVVSNIGDTALQNVVVVDTAPAETAIASAAGAQVDGNRATWTIPSLAPGAEQSFDINLTARAAGEYCNRVVAAANGLSETAQACTTWRGVGALLLEKADDPDPIQIGEATTYTVRVTNQGTADDTNVKVVVQFPEEIDPVSASDGGVVSGKTVTFPAYAVLGPKRAFQFTITARGAKVGDARVTFIRTSDGIPAPTRAEESTRVY